jgi:hypothetical protein
MSTNNKKLAVLKSLLEKYSGKKVVVLSENDFKQAQLLKLNKAKNDLTWNEKTRPPYSGPALDNWKKKKSALQKKIERLSGVKRTEFEKFQDGDTNSVKGMYEESKKIKLKEDFYQEPTSNINHKEIIENISEKSIDRQIGLDYYWVYVRYGGKDVEVGERNTQEMQRTNKLRRKRTPEEAKKRKANAIAVMRETAEDLIKDLENEGYTGWKIAYYGEQGFRINTEQLKENKSLKEDSYFPRDQEVIDQVPLLQNLVDNFVEEQIGSESASGSVMFKGDQIVISEIYNEERQNSKVQNTDSPQNNSDYMKQEWLDTGEDLVSLLGREGYNYEIISASPKSVTLYVVKKNKITEATAADLSDVDKVIKYLIPRIRKHSGGVNGLSIQKNMNQLVINDNNKLHSPTIFIRAAKDLIGNGFTQMGKKVRLNKKTNVFYTALKNKETGVIVYLPF